MLTFFPKKFIYLTYFHETQVHLHHGYHHFSLFRKADTTSKVYQRESASSSPAEFEVGVVRFTSTGMASGVTERVKKKSQELCVFSSRPVLDYQMGFLS